MAFFGRRERVSASSGKGPQPSATPKTAPTGELGYSTEQMQFWTHLAGGETTAELIWPNNVLMYDRMRREDAQVISVLRAVTLPIRRAQWRIAPNGARDEVVQLVSQDLGLPIDGNNTPMPRTAGRFSWEDHLRLALLSLPFGHSFFEQVYRIENGQAHLAKLGWRPPRTITEIDVAPDGGLIAIHQMGFIDKPLDVTIPVNRLVAYVNEREGGNWLGQSLLRAAYKPWLLKDMLLRVGAQAVERNGLGVPVYKASEPPAALTEPDQITQRQNDEIKKGLEIATGLRAGENSGASIPAGAELNLLGVQGSTVDAQPWVKYFDDQIASAVLANFLTLGGDNATGSYALGDSFVDFFTESLQTVARTMASTANQHIVEDLVDLNWGPNEPAPRIVFDEIGSTHQITALAISQLIMCGALTGDDDLEKYLRNSFGLPAPDPDSAREIPQHTAAPTADPNSPTTPAGS